MEGKVAVLGDTDFVMPFFSLGLHTFAVGGGRDEIIEKAEHIVEEKYALVVVSEDIAPLANEVFSEYDNKAMPCVVVVPFTRQSKGYATGELGRVLRMATGVDILKTS